MTSLPLRLLQSTRVASPEVQHRMCRGGKIQYLAWLLWTLLALSPSLTLGQASQGTITWEEQLQRLETLEASGEFESPIHRYSQWIRELEEQPALPQDQLLRALFRSAQALDAAGEFEEALGYVQRHIQLSEEIYGRAHPTTLGAMNQQVSALMQMGELRRAQELQEEVLLLGRSSLEPNDPRLIVAQINLASIHLNSGNLQAAQQGFEQSLESARRAFGEDNGYSLAIRNNLAFVLQSSGELERARQLQEEVLKGCTQSLGKSHRNTIRAHANLANTLRALGDLGGAKERDETILELRTQLLGGEHPETLRSQANLAATYRALGDFQSAKRHFEQILDIRQKTLGSDHWESVQAGIDLALTFQDLAMPMQARRLLEDMFYLSIQHLGSEHPETLRAQAHLAVALRDLGHLEKAEALHLEVFQTRQRIHGPAYRPNTEREAKELFEMGRTQQELGAIDQSVRYFTKGLNALEAQTLRTDPSENVKSRYIARYGSSYKEAIAVGMTAKEPILAFQVLERYRTQSLLALMRWNQSEAAQTIPQDLRSELHRISRRYDWLTRERDRIYPQQSSELVAEKEQLRRRREVIQGEIIAARREQGDLPKPLPVEAIQGFLDSGTLLLSFAIGDDASHLFALTRENLDAVTLDITSDVLATQIDRLRTLDLENDPSGARQALSQWLYERLLAPVASQIQDAQRVLVLPDGPLSFIPFAALTRSVSDDPRGWQYLAEWKPIHSVQSATVYAELLAQRKSNEDPARPWQWVGFGNPVYPAVSDLDPSNVPNAVRSTTERGIWDGLTPLPHTEREIRGIAQLFPEDRIQPFLQHDATEDQARQILGQASIVHFAAHGLADPDYPMDSFLALSLDDGDTTEHNGLLQAWEIADQLHLDADLVVLSACVTALGPNRGGEGLISLSRAFQIAGARSVIASLWSVNDLSTSELMLRFYRHLRAGETKDRALQLAQQELIGGPVEVTLEDGSVVERDFSSPYHWAAFQLIGDWR